MRHPLHSLCPYFAMFPEDFVLKQILAYTRRGDTVFDPFCGRGTTVFESLLNGRQAAGTDINCVAACVAGAKADSPTIRAIERRLRELETDFGRRHPIALPEDEFFRACFHEKTLRQIISLRSQLKWETSKVDRFIAAVTLGCLHGESERSPSYLSNRMPRTISTKPAYSVRWWAANGYIAPERDAFEILRRIARYRLSAEQAPLRGFVKRRDARFAGRAFPKLERQVKLIVTSPPYLDTTDFAEDQWLRLWFLGGTAHPERRTNRDDRHYNTRDYWTFLSEAWAGCERLVAKGTVVVIRIGGSRFEKDELFDGLQKSLRTGFGDFRTKALTAGDTTSIKNRQTNLFRPGTSSHRFEHDFSFALT